MGKATNRCFHQKGQRKFKNQSLECFQKIKRKQRKKTGQIVCMPSMCQTECSTREVQLCPIAVQNVVRVLHFSTSSFRHETSVKVVAGLRVELNYFSAAIDCSKWQCINMTELPNFQKCRVFTLNFLICFFLHNSV